MSAGTRTRVSNAVELKRLRRWLLPDGGRFADFRLHGNTTWDPVDLVWLALCWAWSEARNLTDAFTAAAEQCRRTGVEPMGSYNGMMDVLVRWGERLITRLQPVVHERMKEIGGTHWRNGGFVPIAFDGARSSAPRTADNERALCAENYGKGVTARYGRKKSKGLRRKRNAARKTIPQEPQAWITLMWHMGLRLPWTWRLGPSDSSERDHVKAMVDEFPENTLFCGDAGFVGYPLWSRIVGAGHDFLVRVGANVHLLGEKADCELVHRGQTVLCWPANARRRPPLRLRLVRIRVGRTDMWMLTSVLHRHTLTRKRIAGLYAARWGIEVEIRGLKQTLDRGRLRSRNPKRLMAELHWSLTAMAVAELFALREQLAAEPTDDDPPDPARRSLARTMRALRWALTHPRDVPEEGDDLPTRLRHARTDDYHRRSSKRARHRPRNPDKRPLGEPNLRPLEPDERLRLEGLAA